MHIVRGKLCLDWSTRRARVDDVILALSPSEFETLWLFALCPGQTLSRDLMFRTLRRIEWDGEDRAIDVRVSQVRRKLASFYGQAGVIETMRGEGYRFVPGEDEPIVSRAS